MMYEWRKSLTGFPLKVTFDPVFKMDNLLMFVEISKTPTVGSLLEEIVQRCHLLKNSDSKLLNTTLEVGDSKLLTSENVCALLDVQEANIRYIPLSSSYFKSSSTKNRETISSRTSPPEETTENLNKEPDIIPSLAERSEAPSFRSNNSLSKALERPKRRLTYDSIGYAIQEMLAKQTEQADFIKPSGTNKVVEYQEKMDCDVIKDTAEIGVDIIDGSEIPFDTDELSEEPNRKRRKRKRKRSKKHVENETEANQGNQNFAPNVTQNQKRKHIHFIDDGDDKESCEENESKSHTTSEENFRRVSEDNSSYSSSKSEKPVLDRQFKNIPLASNSIIGKKISCSSSNGICESISTVPEPLHSARIEGSTNSFVLSAGRQLPSSTSSSNIKFPCRDVDSLVPSNRTSFHPMPLQRREQKDDVNIANDLATLLMCKQLKTCCEYDVQFVNQKRNSTDFVKKVLNSVNKSDVVNSKPFECNIKLETKNTNVSSSVADSRPNVESEPWKTVEQPSLVSPRIDGTPLNCNRSCNFVDKDDFKRKTSQETASDCQFLRQFKIEGNIICMRKSNEVWLTLTPEIISSELPDAVSFKDNQSIVFQIMYINKQYCPTVSGLIYAQVLLYKPEVEKLNLDIPPEFMKAVFDDCDENLQPTEEFVQIVGNTYEVHRSSLKNVKLLV